jgi:hypothetical protein
MRFKAATRRIAAIAKEYANSPENTLVVSPDNRSRVEINRSTSASMWNCSGVVSSVVRNAP